MDSSGKLNMEKVAGVYAAPEALQGKAFLEVARTGLLKMVFKKEGLQILARTHNYIAFLIAVFSLGVAAKLFLLENSAMILYALLALKAGTILVAGYMVLAELYRQISRMVNTGGLCEGFSGKP